MPACFRFSLLLLCVLTNGCSLLADDEGAIGFRRDLLDPVNEARASTRLCGSTTFEAAPGLKWNRLLAEAALRHANDVATTGKEGHTGSDWSGPDTRVRDTGYRFEVVGEILATGNRPVEEIIAGFLNSPGHCSVLMGPRFTEAGAAMAGGRAWTIVFAAPDRSDE